MVLLHAGSHDDVLAWHLDLPVVGGIVLGAVVWLALALPHLRRGKLEPRVAASFVAGLWVLFVALASPLDALGEQHLLVAHMLQHELLLGVAPVLLLLGVTPRMLAPVARRTLAPGLRTRRGPAVVRVLAGPELALVVFAGTLLAWHVPTLYAAALASPTWHIVEHVSFVTAGLLLWLPLLEPVPGLVHLGLRAKLLYLAVAQAVVGAVAAVLLLWPDLLYPWYAERPTVGGLSHLADQRLAGGLMLVLDMVIGLAVALWLVLRSLERDEDRARRGARATRKGVAWPST